MRDCEMKMFRSARTDRRQQICIPDTGEMVSSREMVSPISLDLLEDLSVASEIAFRAMANELFAQRLEQETENHKPEGWE